MQRDRRTRAPKIPPMDKWTALAIQMGEMLKRLDALEVKVDLLNERRKQDVKVRNYGRIAPPKSRFG